MESILDEAEVKYANADDYDEDRDANDLRQVRNDQLTNALLVVITSGSTRGRH